jgi:hypothetical protein
MKNSRERIRREQREEKEELRREGVFYVPFTGNR